LTQDETVIIASRHAQEREPLRPGIGRMSSITSNRALP